MNYAWAHLFARSILGLMFFMAGVFKVFQLGPVGHAQRFFLGPYADSFLPKWALWVMGTTIPFVELVAGALLIVGLRVRDAAVAIGLLLVIVTFGHLLAEPLYAFHTQVIPRLALLLVVLLLPRDADRFSIDRVMSRRRRSTLPQ